MQEQETKISELKISMEMYRSRQDTKETEILIKFEDDGHLRDVKNKLIKKGNSGSKKSSRNKRVLARASINQSRQKFFG